MASISKLTINKIEYDIADSALPSAETGSTGDVLTVSEEKAWEAAAPSGGGSDLPSVTDADNGEVLTVVEGAWAKAAIPVFIITEDMLSTPTVDGLSTNTVYLNDGEDEYSMDFYIYDGDFAALGTASAPRVIMAGSGGVWQVYTRYETAYAVADVSAISNTSLCFTGTCQYIELGGSTYILPSDAPLAKGTKE